MADRAGLGVLGFILGGITAVVMLVAATIVVTAQADGRLMLESATPVVANR